MQGHQQGDQEEKGDQGGVWGQGGVQGGQGGVRGVQGGVRGHQQGPRSSINLKSPIVEVKCYLSAQTIDRLN